MSAERDVNRIVRSWLREDDHEAADAILGIVLSRLDTTPQRRSWWPARRFAHMNTYTRIAVAAAAVVAIAIIGYNLLPRSSGVGGEPTAGPTASPVPTATPASTPVPFSATSATGTLRPGSIVLDGAFPLAVAFDVPVGWSRQGFDELADLAGVHKVRGDTTPAWSSWTIVANAYADPCHTASGPIDPPIGPTVDDLVTALTSLVGFVATTPTDVTIDGHAGKRFQLSTTIDPAAEGCDDNVWLSLWEPASGGDTAAVPGAATMQFWVLDVDGTRLVMFTEQYGATAADIAESVAIMESSRFE
jgi:hypothetical protein